MTETLPVCADSTAMVRNVASYSTEGLKQADISLEAISDALQDPAVGFVWVGLYKPDEPLLLKMAKRFVRRWQRLSCPRRPIPLYVCALKRLPRAKPKIPAKPMRCGQPWPN